MDDRQFDDLARGLSHSRRWLLGLGGALGLTPFLSDAKKRKKKTKKKKPPAPLGSQPPCLRDCTVKRCGNDGCGGSCGACEHPFTCSDVAKGGTCICPGGREVCAAGSRCCAECQICDAKRDVCVMKPESDTVACAAGQCCGGACCPPSCQCGVSGGMNATLARWFAEQQGWPYPFCAASGTGQACGCGGSECPAGTTCYLAGGTCSGVCAGRCPGVDYPST